MIARAPGSQSNRCATKCKRLQFSGNHRGEGEEAVFMLMAAALFLAYFANVVAGAFDIGVFLGDLAEMLVLFAASILFTIAILQREARAQVTKDHD